MGPARTAYRSSQVQFKVLEERTEPKQAEYRTAISHLAE